jgi:hypothetical protein
MKIALPIILLIIFIRLCLLAADQPEPAITPGSEQEALKYYANLSKLLKPLNLVTGATRIRGTGQVFRRRWSCLCQSSSFRKTGDEIVRIERSVQ